MSEHMRGDLPADMGTIGYLFYHPLDSPDANLYPVMQPQMPVTVQVVKT